MATIQCSCIGSNGRFGNMLHQDSFCSQYAKLFDCNYECSPWIGQKLFGLNDPPISRPLPRTKEDRWNWGQVDIDLYGYFQNQNCINILSRKALKERYKFLPRYTEAFPKQQNYYIAAHLRRGDYVNKQDYYCVVMQESYLRACDKFGLDKSKIIWVSEETQHPNPFESEGLGFLPDFMTLMNADVILRANSTFSWWASVLSNAKIYSPLLEARRGQRVFEFVDGNWPRCADSRWVDGVLSDLHLPEE